MQGRRPPGESASAVDEGTKDVSSPVPHKQRWSEKAALSQDGGGEYSGGKAAGSWVVSITPTGSTRSCESTAVATRSLRGADEPGYPVDAEDGRGNAKLAGGEEY